MQVTLQEPFLKLYTSSEEPVLGSMLEMKPVKPLVVIIEMQAMGIHFPEQTKLHG